MTVLALVVGAYITICLLAFLLQSRMVFFPDRKLISSPGTTGMDYRDVFFETEDGVKLHGWFIPARHARAVVLFFHGNAGNISHRLDSIRIFNELGLSVLIFDYRGYGKSGGRIGETGTYADARAARAILIDDIRIDPDRIIYFGRSLGSAVAIELSTLKAPLALIAESCFTSVPALGARHYPWLPVRLLSRIGYDSTERITGLTCPKLFIHSRDDDIVPFAMGHQLFELAPEPKSFLEISGDHNTGFLLSGSVYVNGLRDFLSTLNL